MTTQENLTGYPSIDKPWLKYYDQEFLKKPLPKMNIYSYLKEMTREYQGLTALSYYGKDISYKELLQNIDKAAKVLMYIGVKEGDRIMYLMPNIPETAYLLYGSARIGAVADYIDPRPDSVDFKISAKKVLTMFKDEQVKYLVALDQCYLAMLKPIEKELKILGVEQIVIVSASDSMDGKAKKNYLKECMSFNGFSGMIKSIVKTKKIGKLVEEARTDSIIKIMDYSALTAISEDIKLLEVPYKEEMLAVIVHTSGTSSAKPKPIPLSHDNLNIYVHQTFGGNMPMKTRDKALHVLPYFAAFGIVDVVHAGLCHGNNLIEIPEFVISNLGKLVIKYKPQIIIGAPTWFLSMLKDKAYKNKDLSFINMITYGGDSMEISDELSINNFLRERNCITSITKGHGMSETCGCASYAIGEYNSPGTVGIPMPHTTYAVVDPTTKEMLRFEEDKDYIEGELIISSQVVTSGILDGQVIVPHQEYNGESYIFTRDTARMDKNGVMTFLSRSDRSFTRFDGYKIKPYEIENIIKKFKNVQYCIISPYYDEEKFGNVAIADIVLEDNIVPLHEEQVKMVKTLIDELFTCNASVSTRQIPALFRFRESMPLTANSKVNFNALANERITGSEVSVTLEETNISVDEIVVK